MDVTFIGGKMNVGDVVSYVGEYGKRKSRKILAIGSDKDSYEDVKIWKTAYFFISRRS